MIRTDIKTGKTYIDNIPAGALTGIGTPDGKEYCIKPMNAGHLDDSWYNGTFIGDYYGVFVKVYTSEECYFWQMVSKWYYRYGNAVNKMAKLADRAN